MGDTHYLTTKGFSIKDIIMHSKNVEEFQIQLEQSTPLDIYKTMQLATYRNETEIRDSIMEKYGISSIVYQDIKPTARQSIIYIHGPDISQGFKKNTKDIEKLAMRNDINALYISTANNYIKAEEIKQHITSFVQDTNLPVIVIISMHGSKEYNKETGRYDHIVEAYGIFRDEQSIKTKIILQTISDALSGKKYDVILNSCSGAYSLHDAHAILPKESNFFTEGNIPILSEYSLLNNYLSLVAVSDRELSIDDIIKALVYVTIHYRLRKLPS